MDGLCLNQTSCNPPIVQTAEDLNSVLALGKHCLECNLCVEQNVIAT